MATLNAKSTSLEINFPYARSDAVIYEFRLQWLGQNIISSAARFNDAPEDPSIPFQAWDHKKDRLCDTIDRALSKNSPQHWEPIDPFVGICIVPGSVDAFRFSYWISADGQEDLANEMNSFSQKESGEGRIHRDGRLRFESSSSLRGGMWWEHVRDDPVYREGTIEGVRSRVAKAV